MISDAELSIVAEHIACDPDFIISIQTICYHPRSTSIHYGYKFDCNVINLCPLGECHDGDDACRNHWYEKFRENFYD